MCVVGESFKLFDALHCTIIVGLCNKKFIHACANRTGCGNPKFVNLCFSLHGWTIASLIFLTYLSTSIGPSSLYPPQLKNSAISRSASSAASALSSNCSVVILRLDSSCTGDVRTFKRNGHAAFYGYIHIKINRLLAIDAAVNFHCASGYNIGEFCFCCHGIVVALQDYYTLKNSVCK